MQTGDTAIDLKLPKLNEPYLNSTTLQTAIIQPTKENIENNSSNDTDTSDDGANEGFKHYMFFVNSFHHVYLVSTHGDIKFNRQSEKGYLNAEIIHRKCGLCILVEKNSTSVECWSLGENKLFSEIVLSTNSFIKKVLSTQLQSLLIIIILVDGTILFYTLNGSTFIHRGTINAGKHLDLVIIDTDKLICTYHSTSPIDFAHIDLHSISQTQQVLTDKEIMKTLIAFKPPIHPKPIERIILPDDKETATNKTLKIFFMALTKESLCIVHICKQKDISYVRIPGQYDVVSAHVANPNMIYTARGGIINIFKWRCIEGEDDKHDQCDIYHEYHLFVSIDISSSPVLTIKPASDSGKKIFKENKNLHNHVDYLS
jgi:hypothetical protein